MEARADYESVIKLFKDTDQAKVAAAWIKALDAKSWRPAHEQPTTPAERPAAKGASRTPPEGFSQPYRYNCCHCRSPEGKCSHDCHYQTGYRRAAKADLQNTG